MQHLGNRARGHIGLEYLASATNPVAGLLASLTNDAGFRRFTIQQSRATLDQHARRIAVDVGWKSELPDEDDCLPCQVVEQDGGAIPAVIRLTALRFPTSIALAYPESDFAQYIPVIRQHFGSY